ncbi:30S ribosomal protein S1 [Thermoflexus sp.]|uniref:30S ribosomal protein S1 n=1 Tax=Thermoflexus sp. TaxID=1969742 RepID=UPI0025D1A4F6|nr:S1 RNA-binding domain-containing protein [Thermoflexus sp.]MDW8181662.1 S1 RNA-binding domain-containing protein [Anaerolineae bacterium]MCS6963530.1 S1 RNA-binding domain-containing protein [Thermoflexus sp.]MCS7352201.1 S1 RNA-binding domain-containing protein [Thermoflexus sp.]MCX7690491.1 S1 RNA-binding domain-containing protein [Thermoflexus sp.]MDW8185441.1 S1 RNA-binding domain-containing protein [Anaerolineae bacterium]
MRVTEPGYVPPSEDYWMALMTQGEFAASPAPEAEPEEIWEGLGMGRGHPLPMPSPWDLESGEPDWREARTLLESGQPLTVTVVGYNRGGLIVQAERLPRGFIPASHLLQFPNALNGPFRKSALARYVGQTLRVRVIEVDEVGGRFVLSERLAHQDEARIEALLAELRPGEVRRGRVTKVTAFGAFVDLGGFEGLLHLSEMSWGRVTDPGAIVQAGQELEVLVLDVLPEERRVQLSLKRLKPDPWETVAQRYRVGQVVEGIVTTVTHFGAFVRLEEGVEGLLHVSELGDVEVNHPREIVREGQRLQVRIVNIDPGARRIGLSRRGFS